MKLEWSASKNEWLKKVRDVSFEEVTLRIRSADFLDGFDHPDQLKYPGQKILVLEIRGYAYSVPYVETSDGFFLKTIIPSRKLTRKYLGGDES